MKKTTRIATAFIALAGLAATATYAADRDGWNDHSRHMRFEKADADSSGDVTFDEFAAAMNARFANADADKDGKMTVGEIASDRGTTEETVCPDGPQRRRQDRQGRDGSPRFMAARRPRRRLDNDFSLNRHRPLTQPC